MRRDLLRLLACPRCGAAPSVEPGDDPVEEGELACTSCGASYPVRRGVPRLLPDALADDQRRTAEAFGWQWRHFVEMHPQYEEQFLEWILPLRPESFRGRRVLDAGCGIGRHAFFAARYGASEVVALDLSAAVETAREVLADLPNAEVVQGDLTHPPLRGDGGGFDLIYSIGVLHHLPDPEAGFRALATLVRPGGTLFVWVYGHEGNRFVRAVVDPLRKHVTSRLPPPAMRTIAWPLAALLHALVKVVYGPLRGTATGRRLPMTSYLTSLRRFSFRQNYNIVFDQLVAPTSWYVRRSEIEAWFRRASLLDVEISWRNRNSWRASGRRA